MISRFYNTVRYLRWIQIVHQLRGRLLKGRRLPGLGPYPVPTPRPRDGAGWIAPIPKPRSWLDGSSFRFLNVTQAIDHPDAWNHPDCQKLWLYNLHYHDWLGQSGLPDADPGNVADASRNLLDRWIAENPAGIGIGWEPYPVSLRIVNWIKWHLAGNPLAEHQAASLAAQIQWLSEHLEYHLLANHLWANAKALVCGGLIFEGDTAESWLRKGLRLLHQELREQILPDGGHFERSPMYHAVILEDVLDLLNIGRCYKAIPGLDPVLADLKSTAPRMLEWLDLMCHPDGEIAFFNDATLGIAPANQDLRDYARRFNAFPMPDPATSPAARLLESSGFARLTDGPLVLLADVGRIGPDYQPGHAHAEALSFELSVSNQRCLVNSGISTYQGADRSRQRSAPAHNCLVVDGADSSEVWAAHRVARRANVRVERIATNNLVATHDGYQRIRGVGVHRRQWRLDTGRLEIVDELEGTGQHEVRLLFHLHPRWTARQMTPYQVAVQCGPTCLRIEGCGAMPVQVVEDRYHPGFGETHAGCCIEYRAMQPLPMTCRTILDYDGKNRLD